MKRAAHESYVRPVVLMVGGTLGSRRVNEWKRVFSAYPAYPAFPTFPENSRVFHPGATLPGALQGLLRLLRRNDEPSHPHPHCVGCRTQTGIRRQ